MKKINKIAIKRIPDYDADLSFLGTFDSEKKSEFAIEHEPDDHRTHNWFNPGNAENKKDAQKDYERMMEYERGSWRMIGIRAEAETALDIGAGNWKIDHLTSGGLWGIEDDSEEKYIKEVEDEQLEELKGYLLEYGFTQEQIDSAEIIRD